MSVRRIFVEKKPEFAVKAGELKEELEKYLGISHVKGVRVLVRYDVEICPRRPTARPWEPSFPSRRWIWYMKRSSPRIRGIWYFPWSICRGSLTSGRTRRNSA